MTMLEYQLIKDHEYLIKVKKHISKKEVKKMLRDTLKGKK